MGALESWYRAGYSPRLGASPERNPLRQRVQNYPMELRTSSGTRPVSFGTPGGAGLRFPKTVGQVGEIVMKGPMVFKGYWNLDEDTKYTFREGWHHTGDMGRFDEDGFLWYAGRKPEKELIMLKERIL